MQWKPNKWVAAVLTFLGGPFGFLYVAAWRAALGFSIVVLALGGAVFFYPAGSKGALAIDAARFLAGAVGAVLAFRMAARMAAGAERPWYARWTGLLGIFAAFAAVVIGIRAFVYEPFRIPSSAMLPTLEIGDRIVVRKWGYGHYSAFGFMLARGAGEPLQRGDLAVFDYPLDPSQTYIKRVLAVGGDRIGLHGNTLIVNGETARLTQASDYLDPQAPRFYPRFHESVGGSTRDIVFARDEPATIDAMNGFQFSESCRIKAADIDCVLPPNTYFVSGDNRNNSLDSRYWGLLRADQVIGKVVKIIH